MSPSVGCKVPPKFRRFDTWRNRNDQVVLESSDVAFRFAGCCFSHGPARIKPELENWIRSRRIYWLDRSDVLLRLSNMASSPDCFLGHIAALEPESGLLNDRFWLFSAFPHNSKVLSEESNSSQEWTDAVQRSNRRNFHVTAGLLQICDIST